MIFYVYYIQNDEKYILNLTVPVFYPFIVLNILLNCNYTDYVMDIRSVRMRKFRTNVVHLCIGGSLSVHQEELSSVSANGQTEIMWDLRFSCWWLKIIVFWDVTLCMWYLLMFQGNWLSFQGRRVNWIWRNGIGKGSTGTGDFGESVWISHVKEC
jgi:hypothetical protein